MVFLRTSRNAHAASLSCPPTHPAAVRPVSVPVSPETDLRSFLALVSSVHCCRDRWWTAVGATRDETALLAVRLVWERAWLRARRRAAAATYASQQAREPRVQRSTKEITHHPTPSRPNGRELTSVTRCNGRRVRPLCAGCCGQQTGAVSACCSVMRECGR